MSCGELFLKNASSIFTGYFLIVSIAFILYGLTTSVYFLNSNTVEVLDKELVAVPSVGLIVCGCALFLIIILGCCAVCREIPCCLDTYSFLLVFLAASQIGLGVFSLMRFSENDTNLSESIYNEVCQMFDSYDEDPLQMDTTQKWMKCCGYNEGPNDYSVQNKSLPVSCCENDYQNCTIGSTEVFPENCYFKLYDFIVGTNYIIGLSLLVTAATEVAASIMGVGLSCGFWRKNRIMWI